MNSRLNNKAAILYFERIDDKFYEASLTSNSKIKVNYAVVNGFEKDESFIRVHKNYVVNKQHIKVAALNFMVVGKSEVPMDFAIRDQVEEIINNSRVII